MLDTGFLNIPCSESMIIWPRHHQSDLSTPDFDPNCDLKHYEEPANMPMENGPMEKLIVLSYSKIPLAVS